MTPLHHHPIGRGILAHNPSGPQNYIASLGDCMFVRRMELVTCPNECFLEVGFRNVPPHMHMSHTYVPTHTHATATAPAHATAHAPAPTQALHTPLHKHPHMHMPLHKHMHMHTPLHKRLHMHRPTVVPHVSPPNGQCHLTLGPLMLCLCVHVAHLCT
ncbi:hypothetical protein O181_059923 [Austropuccinia psidii MF-1]|uniref:Uncharacterized protein n=1 Tax=Austropuccinia psidii MF-1 TaxID=1389203 RepID=A0A9Q3HX03_9BASI|nr:hypothetical protein [Austropuccinia psidii MF-1]